MSYDTIIRNGTSIDGTGAAGYSGDIGIADGVITAIGSVTGRARRILDADGALVTPGFIDIHTHYDGQVSWDPILKPSVNHGVTTAIMGNCGVGFAPVRPRDHDTIISLMEGVEDIPGTALHEGITWEWETFGEYLDALDRLDRTIDIGLQVPHNPIRLHVMGERAIRREAATDDDIETMQTLVVEALRQGALGFTTANTVNHRDADGNPTYARHVAKEELFRIGDAMGDAGLGVLQLFNDFYRENAHDFPTLIEWARRSGRPLCFTLEEDAAWPTGFWQDILRKVDIAQQAGISIRPQVAPRSLGAILGLSASLNPFTVRPSYIALSHLPVDEQVRAMRDPVMKERILRDEPLKMSTLKASVTERADPYFADAAAMTKRMWVLDESPDYEQTAEQSVRAMALRAGREPDEFVYDLLLENNGSTMLFTPAVNYTAGNFDAVHDMLTSRHAMMALSDGGAHVGYICDGSFPTYLIDFWTRGRTRGPTLSVEEAVRLQTTAPAHHLSLFDRAKLAVGKRADINVIDYDRLAIGKPYLTNDLPAGGGRLLQDATGYLATFNHGVQIVENDVVTDERPGRVIRGSQKGPRS
jgi:N-acyl-D-aspartate/D-glutamate deacylase